MTHRPETQGPTTTSTNLQVNRHRSALAQPMHPRLSHVSLLQAVHELCWAPGTSVWGPGCGDGSYPGHSLLLVDHQKVKDKPNYTSTFKTLAYLQPCVRVQSKSHGKANFREAWKPWEVEGVKVCPMIPVVLGGRAGTGAGDRQLPLHPVRTSGRKCLYVPRTWQSCQCDCFKHFPLYT